MYKTTRIFWLSVLILISFHLGIWSAGGEDKLPGMDLSGIHYKNVYLKVSVKNQDFHKVMQEVAKKSGVKIVINDSMYKELNIDFDYTPLEKGIKRLLKGTNYVFIYRSEESGSFGRSSGLVKVLVFPKSGGWSMAGLGELAEDRSTGRTKQTRAMEEIFTLDQEARDNILKHFPQKGIDLESQLSNALEKIQEMDLFGSPQFEADLIEKINKASEGLQAGKRLEEQQKETIETMPEEGGAPEQADPGIEAIKKHIRKIELHQLGSVNSE